MRKKLSPSEQIGKVRRVLTDLNVLVKDGALAGIILTDEAYDKFKTVFGPNASPFKPAEIDLDPQMEHSLIVDELLVLRGTRV